LTKYIKHNAEHKYVISMFESYVGMLGKSHR